MSSALCCRDLSVAPGGRPVLNGVDFEVPAGRRAALVGPSGAGKTTLLRAIAGLEPVTSGAVTLAGRDLAGVDAHRRRIAVVFQEPRLLPHLDVADNVALSLRAAGVSRNERRRRARELLDRVGLGGMGERAVRGLSGGEQQRVALARALTGQPELLLLDEPLAALDPNRREALRSLIVEVQRALGLTTVLVTHDRTEAAELGETIALMLEGRIVQHGPARELFERPATASIARFFGAVNILRGEVSAGHLEFGASEALPVNGPDGPATYVVRPEALTVAHAGTVRAVVEEVVYAGTHARLVLRSNEQRLEAIVAPGRRLVPGDRVRVSATSSGLWRIPHAAAEPRAEPVSPAP